MHLFFSIFLLSIFPFYLFSQTIPIEDLDTEKLSQNTTWLKLLHYDKKLKKSTIISDDFFLSPKGKISPKSELISTLEAYFEKEKTDKNATCRFPARYYWLSTQINLPNYQMIESSCKKLSNWSMLKDTTSISLIYVSGYLGNPASTFGHSFLKLNTDKSDEDSSLFDLSISYGALVPDNEAAPVYIFKGLTGGYEAGFSDKYYYTQDLVYSNTEFRDIWDYKINLNLDDKKLLLLHIWEIIGKKFQYFFLNKNCAYEVSRLLELVIDEPIIHHSNYWYAPVETCHSLRDIDFIRKIKGSTPLINTIRYVPSQQRVIYSQYNNLSLKEKHIVFDMIKNKFDYIPLQYINLLEDEKIEIIDFVLSYYKYMLVKNVNDDVIILHKNKILLQRLQLPVKKYKRAPILARGSPDFDNRPISLSLLFSFNNNDYYPSIRVAPFSIESIGQNTLSGNELKVLDTTIGINSKQDNLFIDRIDFIKVRNFNTLQLPFDKESQLSWQMNISAEYLNNKKRDYDFFIDTSFGKAWRINEMVMLYNMINISEHVIYPHVRLEPNIGIHLDLYKLKVMFFAGLETDLKIDSFQKRLELEGSYKFLKDTAFSFKYIKNKREKVLFGLQWFF